MDDERCDRSSALVLGRARRVHESDSRVATAHPAGDRPTEPDRADELPRVGLRHLVPRLQPATGSFAHVPEEAAPRELVTHGGGDWRRSGANADGALLRGVARSP